MSLWTADEDAELRRRRAKGESCAQIGAAIGRSADSVEGRLKRLKPDPVPSSATLEMENAALRAKLSAVESKSRAGVVCEADEDEEEDWGQAWKKAEEDSAKRIARSRKQTQLSVSLGNKPVAIALVSDQHIAPGTPVDFKRMREDAELIAQTDGLYAALGGDGVDNHIRILPAILAARSQPDDQWNLFNYYLEIFGEKILALVAGNHDLWTNQVPGWTC